MVRVRLRFDSTPLHYARQCWFLFDPDSCRLVGDVAYLIARRFGLQDTAGIQLYMDDCLIPSNESALILKDNDMLQGTKSPELNLRLLICQWVRTLPDEETSITYTDASTSPEKWKATPLKRQKLDHSKKKKRKKEKEKRETVTKKTTSPPPVEATKQTGRQKQTNSLQQTSQATDFLSGVLPSLRRTPPVRVVTTQSAGGAIHTKFCSSSDSEPDELPSSVMAATHTENTSTITSPLSKQPPPSGESKGRKKKRTFPSIVGGPSDVHTTRSVVHQRPEEPLTQEQRLEDDVSSCGETGTKEEEDKASKEPSGGVEPAPGTVRDYAALPDLHGPPRNGDQIAFKTLELSLPNYTPEVSEYKEAAVLGYDAATKMVKLKLSEATVKQEMQKARKRLNGRFTLMEEVQEPLVDCQEMVELNLESLMNPKLIS